MDTFRTAHDIRIVALDLDGTLLDSQKRLSERNRASLARVAAQGVHVVPTTGRFFGMMPPAVRDLPFVRYAITINGAQVYDRVTDETIVREEIPLDLALGIMETLDRYDVVYDCYRQSWGWMTAAQQAKAADYATDAHYLKMVREFRRPVPELKAHLRETAAEGDVQKIMLFATNRDRAAAADCLGRLAREVGLSCTGIGARVALYYWPSALIREFIAVFVTRSFLIPALLGWLLFISHILFALAR